eukprot:4998680-Ditylum_brightwellii.AAC.1
MIQRPWIKSDGGDSTSLRLTKLTEAHFTKDGYSHMRCFLAFQVMGATVLHLIDTYADDCDGKDIYAPLCTIVEKVDTLVDIMNSRVEKEFRQINSPTHCHLDESVSILCVLLEWQQEVEECGKSEHFVPQTAYQDICWLCLGTVGLAHHYLRED